MEQKDANIEDWRENISDSDSATLKIQDGETKQVVFLDEGRKNNHPDFGESIVFIVEYGGEHMKFYVNPTNFSLLKQIKKLGILTGQVCNISRIGSKKSDTRYFIESIQSEEP